MVVGELKKAVSQALIELGVNNPEVSLEHPKDIAHGDYSFATMKVKVPALTLATELQKNLPRAVARVEAVGGFVNFYLAPEFFAEQVKGILEQKDDFGKNNHCAGMRALVEHTQPNPFKEFHIGHLVNNAVGEALSRVIEFCGADTTRVTYHGDIGLHVAKSIWGLQKLGIEPKNTAELGKAYAEGDKAYTDDEAAKKEITALNKKIYEQSDEKINALYEKGRRISLEHFDALYKRLDSSFNGHFFESEAGKVGTEIVRQFLEKGIFEKSDGAIIFAGEKYGLHTRVFLNSEGLPTYEAKDVGLIKLKAEKFPFDFSLTVTDVEQASYFAVVKKAMELVFPEYKGKITHVSHGRMRLPTGRISSRLGTIIPAEELLNKVKALVLEKMKERDMSDKETVADKIAVGAIRYSILKQALGSNIVFDFEKSISFEGDSGPYLQYSHARAMSVLRKAGEHHPLASRTRLSPSTEGERQKGVGILERLLYRFPEIVERAGKEYAPHYIATYLIEIAGAFNSWYAKERILDAGEDTPYRLVLTSAFAQVMKNGLWLLGIAAPENM